MGEVIETLSQDAPAPYCRVDFLNPSYDCLRGFSNASLVAEFLCAGRALRSASVIRFPDPTMPILSKLISQISILDQDGQGLLWWPSHMKSGEVRALDGAAIRSVVTKTRLAKRYDWQGASEKWLLLLALGHGLTDIFGSTLKISLPTIDCPFTQILIWDKFSEDIWTIWPRFHVVCDGGRQKRDMSFLPGSLRPFATRSRYYPTRPRSG